MPGEHCCMPGCVADSTKEDCKSLSFHRIPKIPNKNAEGYKEWRAQVIHKICRSDNYNKDTATICSLHYEPDCFNYGKMGARRTLAFGSLPTKLLKEKSIVTPLKAPRKEPMVRPCPEVKIRVAYSSLQDVMKDVAKLQYPWVLINKTEKLINIAYIEQDQIKYNVKIDDQFNTAVTVDNFQASTHNSNIEQIRLNSYLKGLTEITLCKGIRKRKYKKYAKFLITKSNHTYYKHIIYTENEAGITSRSTIRSTKCQRSCNSTESTLCTECKKILTLVKKKHKRTQQNDQRPISKHTPLQGQAKRKLTEALKKLRLKQQRLQKQINNFKHAIETEGVNIHKGMHEKMTEVLNDSDIDNDNDLMKIFWQEQQKAFTRKKGGMRWHPTMIRLAILLHSRSPAAYETLRESGVLRLPGATTLRDYTNIITPKSGRNKDVVKDIIETTKHFTDNQRFVVLLHDEMSVKADLVYDRTNKEVIGFVDPEGTKPWTYDNISEQKMATHVLVFFIVGVNTNLSRSVFYYPTANATSAELYQHFWEVVGELEISCNLHVIACTSDKAAANQKMITMQTDDHKTINLFSPDRYIYFFSDAPHLLKTIRNNLFHSGHGKNKLLWNKSKHLEWKHVCDIYRNDSMTELRRSKLTSDHVNLTPHTIMNVKLAAQVMSSSVGKLMETLGGEQCSETATFIQMTDRFFDCLNVRAVYEADRKIKEDLAPYTSTSDSRFQFLRDYLQYIEDWKDNVATRPGTFTKAQRRLMFLSDQTYTGIKTTVNSTIECTQFLLENDVNFVLTNVFCQDPLEAHFGRHRGVSGHADNPTVYKFGHQDKKLTIQRNMALLIQPRGNVEKRKHAIKVRGSPMKKKCKLN